LRRKTQKLSTVLALEVDMGGISRFWSWSRQDRDQLAHLYLEDKSENLETKITNKRMGTNFHVTPPSQKQETN
jgi:hypothetical protein